MIYTQVTNLRYYNPEHTAIIMDVLFERWTQPVEFIAIPTDIEVHGVELYTRAVAGDFGPISDYVDPTQPQQ